MNYSTQEMFSDAAVIGAGNTVSEVIADSLNIWGDRLTTFRLHYPRFIHCFDGDTEVLSQINDEMPKFRHFKAIDILKCKVAQYDNGVVSFVHPDSYIENSGVHDMVCHDSNKFSLNVTDEHRVRIKKRTSNNAFNTKVIKAKELLGDFGTIRIDQSGELGDDEFNELLDAEVQLIMFYVADGHKPKLGKQCNFHFKKQRKVDFVIDLFTKLNIEYNIRKYDDEVVIDFDHLPWIDRCYTSDNEKKLPDFMYRMSNSNYESFKIAALLSDGNVKNHDYNTTSHELANQMQVIAHLHNDSMNIRLYGSMYKQTFKKVNYISFRHDKSEFIKSRFNGTVYCVTVPSGFIMVRRSGIVSISGNCEVMTHRMFSRNASSSRAIPVTKMLDQVNNTPAKPIHWGANQPGMQAKPGDHDGVALSPRSMLLSNGDALWNDASKYAANISMCMHNAGYHKQIVNRITEPFQFMNVIISVTDIHNFFWLRLHTDAQPEFRELSKVMYESYQQSKPELLRHGQYHTPYVEHVPKSTGNNSFEYQVNGEIVSLEDAIKISASCCAQVSYRNLDTSLNKARKIYNALITMKPLHSSPFEHVATPFNEDEHMIRTQASQVMKNIDNNTCNPDIAMYNGNYRGWTQLRKQFADENITIQYNT